MRKLLTNWICVAVSVSFTLWVGGASAEKSAFDKLYDPKTKTIHLNPEPDILGKNRAPRE